MANFKEGVFLNIHFVNNEFLNAFNSVLVYHFDSSYLYFTFFNCKFQRHLGVLCIFLLFLFFFFCSQFDKSACPLRNQLSLLLFGDKLQKKFLIISQLLLQLICSLAYCCPDHSVCGLLLDAFEVHVKVVLHLIFVKFFFSLDFWVIERVFHFLLLHFISGLL